MNVVATPLADLVVLEPKVFSDERGFFLETHQSERFEAAGLPRTFVQDMWSHSKRGVLRGLHYQLPRPQGKLVYVVSGAVFDVAVDIRRDSPTFGKWYGVELSSENKRQLWVPPGFAHGFYALSESVDMMYKCTEFYVPGADRYLLWNDPDIGIHWPLSGAPTLSPKDAAASTLKDAVL
jgi:dTDP-4-dehydrorhamnose 3,5-epimerase